VPQIEVYHDKELNRDQKDALVTSIKKTLGAGNPLNLPAEGIDVDFKLREYPGVSDKVTVFVIGLFDKPDRIESIIKNWTVEVHKGMSQILHEAGYKCIVEIVPIMADPKLCTCGPNEI
jgi:hypothetical protein